MPTQAFKVKTIIKAYFTSVDLYLESHRISLSYDGNETYKSTDILQLDDTPLGGRSNLRIRLFPGGRRPPEMETR